MCLRFLVRPHHFNTDRGGRVNVEDYMPLDPNSAARLSVPLASTADLLSPSSLGSATAVCGYGQCLRALHTVRMTPPVVRWRVSLQTPQSESLYAMASDGMAANCKLCTTLLHPGSSMYLLFRRSAEPLSAQC